MVPAVIPERNILTGFSNYFSNNMNNTGTNFPMFWDLLIHYLLNGPMLYKLGKEELFLYLHIRVGRIFSFSIMVMLIQLQVILVDLHILTGKVQLLQTLWNFLLVGTVLILSWMGLKLRLLSALYYQPHS